MGTVLSASAFAETKWAVPSFHSEQSKFVIIPAVALDPVRVLRGGIIPVPGSEGFHQAVGIKTGIRRQGGDPIPGNDGIRAETVCTPVTADRTDAAQGGAFRLNHPDFLFTDLTAAAHDFIPPANGRNYSKEGGILQDEKESGITGNGESKCCPLREKPNNKMTGSNEMSEKP